MAPDELNGLAVDIAANGLLDEIVLTPDGDILDGRNRHAACELVKVEPRFVTYDGDPWSYSRSQNLWRRNLTTGQRAAVCALSLVAEGKRKNGRWARGSVPGDGDTSESRSNWSESMAKAGLAADWSHDGDLLLLVRDGNLALDAAYKRAKERQDKAEWESEQERKAAEQEIAFADSELARLLGTGHVALNLEREALLGASDPDNWRGVLNLADRVIALWTTTKGRAREQLEV